MPSRAESITNRPATEQPIYKWITLNRGEISRIARDANVTPTTVHLIAYNKRGPSRDLRIERALKMAGCPLIQKLG